MKSSTGTRNAEAHYYVFYYPLGPKTKMKHYLGPFKTRADARFAMREELRLYDPTRRSYKIRRGAGGFAREIALDAARST